MNKNESEQRGSGESKRVKSGQDLVKVCAWCNPGVTGKNVSHGICPECFKKMIKSIPTDKQIKGLGEFI